MTASIRKAASPAYYLGETKARGPEGALFSDGATLDGVATYYDPAPDLSPLFVKPVWAGKLGEALGLARGSAVSKQGFLSAFYAIDPADGVSSLLKGGPSVAEQIKAQQRIAKAEGELFGARDNLNKRRSALFNSGMDRALVDSDSGVEKIGRDVERLQAKLDKARQAKENRKSADDITFSAPKGASVLWARYKTEGMTGDAESARKAKAIEAAMIEAVSDVIEKYIEPRLLFTRSRNGSNKARDHDHIKGIMAALVTHFDARPTEETVADPSAPGGERIVVRKPDPQLHVHAVLMNMGMDFEDEIKALWTTFLGSHIKVVGAAFRAEFAHKLRAMGIELQVDEQEKVLSFDVAGISKDVAGSLSARRGQVVANLDEGMDSEDAALSGRASKMEYTGEELLAHWNQTLDAMGLSSRQIEATTNAQIAAEEAQAALEGAAAAGGLAFDKGSAEWARALGAKMKSILAKLEGAAPSVDEAVAKLLEMETAFTMADIHRLAFESAQFCGALPEGQTPMGWAEDFAASILSHRELKRIHDLDDYGRPTFTSNGLLRRERELYFSSVPKMLAPRTDALSTQVVDEAIARYETSQAAMSGRPFKLADFQRDMVHEVARNPGSIHIALAPAGSGKTTSILGAVMAFESLGARVFSLAPSNKAAQGLATGIRKTRADGLPLESFINGVANGSIVLTSADVIVVDEASMVGFENAKGVVDAALAAAGGPARLVLIGDTEQLPSVGRGNFLRTLAESDMFTARGGAGVANITRVARVAADWVRINRQRDDLGKQATTFFALGQTAKAIDIYERMGALTLSATREQALEGLAFDAYLPLAGAAEHLNEVLAAVGDRHRAFARRGHAAAMTVARANHGAVSEEAFVAAFPEADQDQARQWLEDNVAISAARDPLVRAYSDTLILATKKVDVAELNRRARSILKEIGALGGIDGQQRVTIPRGRVGSFEICEGERLAFTEKADSTRARFSVAGDMAAKTTVGTVLGISNNAHGDVILTMRLDGQDGGLAEVNTKLFANFTHAYAMTAHASQGATCDRVFKYLSDFASMQTEYVGDTRHRDVLGMRAVESDYGIYKKRAAEAIEKTDAKDLAFAADHYALDAEQLADLDRSWEEGKVRTERTASRLEESRLRSIAQGALVEHGMAPLGFKEGRPPTHYAKIMVRGRPITLWGAGIALAIKELGAEVGDHIGLEPLSATLASKSASQWRGYSSAQLRSAGLLLDQAGMDERAAKAMAGRSGSTSAADGSVESVVESKFTSDKDALAIARAAVARTSELAALRAQERGALEELNRMASLPADLDLRLAAAMRALPFAKAGSGDKIRRALADGIAAMPHARPMIKDGREWLASDSELTYCVTEWGAVEAWSSKELGADMLAEAAQGGRIERLAERRLEAVELARRAALDPVRQAIAALGDRIEISIVEHAEHGMCLGLNAAVSGTHLTDPQLKRLFAGKAEYGQDASMAKGGIKGLRHCKKYDGAAQAWIFPLKCDAYGAPKGEQPAVAELMELGARLGHSLVARTAWDERRAEAWDAIEDRLSSPWGLAFAQSTEAMGIKIMAKRGVLSGFAKKSDDIARWDGQLSEGLDPTQQWAMCPDKDAEGMTLANGSRRLAGIVLHADGDDVFVMSGLGILAIGRAELGLDAPADELLGKRVAIAFVAAADGAGATPKLESIEEDAVLALGEKAAARFVAGEVFDASKLSPGQAAAFGRAAKLGASTPEDKGYALAWAGREAAQLEAVRAQRAEGIEAESADAAPLEAFSAPDKLRPKKAKVLAIGANGVVMSIGARKFIADKEEMRMAMPRQLKVGKSVDLRLARGANGRISVDSAATAKSLGLSAS